MRRIAEGQCQTCRPVPVAEPQRSRVDGERAAQVRVESDHHGEISRPGLDGVHGGDGELLPVAQPLMTLRNGRRSVKVRHKVSAVPADMLPPTA